MVLWNFDLLWKTMVLWNFDLLWKNYGTMEKTMIHCTMDKTMVLWRKNGYHNIARTMELDYYGKNMVDYQKLKTFI